jgi:hypothetical protein
MKRLVKLSASYVAAILTLAFMGSGSFAADAESPPSNRPIRDKWALVIGISDFSNSALDLKYSAKDASDFAEYLKHDAGFAPDHVRVLLNKDATQRRILSELGNKWLPHVANPDDLVVIFISTHGSGSELDIGGQNYLIAYDTDVNDLYTTGIPMQRLAHDIKDRVHCDRVVIFLDACHSGATESGGKGLVRTGVDAGEFSAGSGQLVIASSKEDQISWESKKLPNGVFTAVLLDALKKQGTSTTLGQMFAGLKDNVQDTVLRERGFLQTPVMKSQWTGNDILISAKPTSPRPGLEADSRSVESEDHGSDAPPVTPSRRELLVTSDEKYGITPADAKPEPVNPRILIVPNKSVARMKLGMNAGEVLQLLGKPTSSKGDVITYWTSDHRYFLSVLLNASTVSEIAFSSPAFKTENAISLANYLTNSAKFSEPVKRTNYSVMTLRGGGFSVIAKSHGNELPVGVVSSSTSGSHQSRWWEVGAIAPPPKSTSSGTTLSASKHEESQITSTLIVPGSSLAKAKLGMNKNTLLELLGEPSNEQGDHLAYWTKDGQTFLCVNFVNDSISDIVFSSKDFLSDNGLSVSNFTSTGHRDLFLPPKQDARNSSQIYTLKQGGLSMAKRTNAIPIGWIHAKGAQPVTLPWFPSAP